MSVHLLALVLGYGKINMDDMNAENGEKKKLNKNLLSHAKRNQ